MLFDWLAREITEHEVKIRPDWFTSSEVKLLHHIELRNEARHNRNIGPPSEDKITRVIKKNKNSKTPGLLGLMTNMIKCLPNEEGLAMESNKETIWHQFFSIYVMQVAFETLQKHIGDEKQSSDTFQTQKIEGDS